MNESTFSSPRPFHGGMTYSEPVPGKLANGPSRLSPLLLLKRSTALRTLPASSCPRRRDQGPDDRAVWRRPSPLSVELSISFLFPASTPQQTPHLPYSRPPLWAHSAPNNRLKRIRRWSLGEDLGLPRFPEPHYSPGIGPVIGSARASPGASSAEVCSDFSCFSRPFPPSSKM